MKKLIYVTVLLAFVMACNSSENKGSGNASATTKVSGSVQEISAQIEQDPTNPELYYRRAQLYFDEKYLDKAISDMDQAISLREDNALYYLQKGRILYAMNKTVDASKQYEKAIAVKPDFVEAKMKLAELYYLVKEHKKSLDLYNSVLETEPKNTTVLFYKGMNYKEMGDTASAIQVFQKAYELDARYYDAVMQLGNLYAALRNKIALDYYVTASRIKPKSPEPPYSAGVFYQQQRDYKRAIGMYRQALKGNERYYQAYYNSSLINVEMANYDEAIQNLNTVIRIEPGLVDAYYMRGLCYEQKKNKEEARINYQYTLELNPKHDMALKALSRLK